MTNRIAMRNKLARTSTPGNWESVENEFEYLYKALAQLQDTVAGLSGGSATVDLSDYVKGPSPAASVQDEIALYSGTTGRLLKRATGSGVVHATSGVYSVGLVNLNTEVTGLLPLGNLNLDGNATHVLFGDGSMRALVKTDISDFSHRLLSTEHSDTTANTPEPGAIIVGVASGETVDSELYWLDGAPTPAVSVLDDLGTDVYWIDGEPLPAIGYSSIGRWAKLDPPAHAEMILKWNGVTFAWISYP